MEDVVRRRIKPIAALKAAHHSIDHYRIDQRAIGRDAHHLRGFLRARRVVITIQHVVLAAPMTRNALLPAHLLDDVVRRSGGSGHHHPIHQSGPFHALNDVPQHRPFFDLRQALARQPARPHARLDDRHHRSLARFARPIQRLRPSLFRRLFGCFHHPNNIPALFEIDHGPRSAPERFQEVNHLRYIHVVRFKNVRDTFPTRLLG